MFGNPSWFRKKHLGWGLTPVSWRGWVYSAGWSAVIAVPFVILMSRHQIVEALVWCGAAMLALLFDVRSVLRKIDGPKLDPPPVTRHAVARPKVVRPTAEPELFVIDE